MTPSILTSISKALSSPTQLTQGLAKLSTRATSSKTI